jgi:hypothetical protein
MRFLPRIGLRNIVFFTPQLEINFDRRQEHYRGTPDEDGYYEDPVGYAYGIGGVDTQVGIELMLTVEITGELFRQFAGQ